MNELAGRLRLRPGAEPPIAGTRAIVGSAMMNRLAAGRHAALVPDLLAAVFSLCAGMQRRTGLRALRAASGCTEAPDHNEARRALLETAREHLQRLALAPGGAAPLAADSAWLRDAPVLALARESSAAVCAQIAADLAGWIERRLLGLPAAVWLSRWQAAGEDWLSEWAASSTHPVARALSGQRDAARACVLPCRALAPAEEGEAGWLRLAADLADDPEFATRPTWNGAPAETGPWTRAAAAPAPGAPSLWWRQGERLADLVRCALGQPLASGALQVGPGTGLAWNEMARGLLIHWVELAPGAADNARVNTYRVLAPTEWNFHPRGALADSLRGGRPDAARALLAGAVLDPCVEFVVEAGDA